MHFKSYKSFTDSLFTHSGNHSQGLGYACLGCHHRRARATNVFLAHRPAISWRAVFLIEYFAPLIIHPLMYIWNFHIGHNTPSQVQRQVLFKQFSFATESGDIITDAFFITSLACAMVVLHFSKRELETVFVHRFSHATMPFRNVFKVSP